MRERRLNWSVRTAKAFCMKRASTSRLGVLKSSKYVDTGEDVRLILSSARKPVEIFEFRTGSARCGGCLQTVWGKRREKARH